MIREIGTTLGDKKLDREIEEEESSARDPQKMR